MFGLSLLVSGLAWWLGLYLLARDPRKPLLWWAGVGMIGYSAAVVVPHPVLVGVPSLAWTGAILVLARPELTRWWAGGVAVFLVASFWLPWIVLLPLAVSTVLALRKRAYFSLVGVMFGLSAGAFLLRLLPDALTLPMIGFDLVVFGVLVAVTDAVEEGEAIRADMLRSLVIAGFTAVLFGSQVVLFGGPDLLAFTTVAAAIAVQVLANPLASVVDRLAVPTVAAERAELREAAESLPKRRPLITEDEAEFARLTRKALSHYGDLGKLVASPLIALTDEGPPLERAARLKSMLLSSIQRLKPADGDFGTSDEWRYYNAVYFYYVKGIRPYSVRTKREDLDAEDRRALQWFVTQVPERTLHNWQNAAARLVAADLVAGVGSA
ncbi:NnrS family protein [Lentzea sp. CC55]|uniref:NnrS family protein n=1 Tax=Lentzea sp. CC55 TaxID=2884909 RepID=UPI001F177C46|nr:NnrS family protein [Lentzea sp. CC55]MCG8928268.1 NnrS family protein [Lentzea sp. CC55]